MYLKLISKPVVNYKRKSLTELQKQIKKIKEHQAKIIQTKRRNLK